MARLVCRATALIALIATYSCVNTTPAGSLPVYARRYGVQCSSCHSVAPMLNKFGLAFQANHFSWPGRDGRHGAGDAVPLSALVTTSYLNSQTDGSASTDFRAAELYASNSFSVGGDRRGGYFANLMAVGNGPNNTAGDLDDVYAALPLAGRRGQLAAVVGQFTPLLYQWDPVNSLADALPAALDEPVDDISLTGSAPGARLDYFSGRQTGSADGLYLSAESPFEGHLQLNHGGRVDGSHGVLIHGFVRRGYSTVGGIVYVRGANNLAGLLGTHEVAHNLQLLAAAITGRDGDGSVSRYALQADFLRPPQLAITGRLEATAGRESGVAPVVAVTYYPLRVQVLRVTAEAVQRKGDRSFILFVRAQL